MILAFALFFALPDSPLPKPQPIENKPAYSQFMDKPAKIAFAANVSLFAFDAAQTCHNLANGGHEHYLPSQSCAGTTAIMGAEMGALWLGARIAHQHHWHKLERIFEWTMPAVNAKAIIYSKEHGAL